MSGNKVRAFGPGLEPRGNVVGEPASFTVETANAGKGKLDVAVNDPKGKQVKCDAVPLKDKKTIYSCEYIPHMEGKFKIVITFGGKEVAKSPFYVEIVKTVVGVSKLAAKYPADIVRQPDVPQKPAKIPPEKTDTKKGVKQTTGFTPKSESEAKLEPSTTKSSDAETSLLTEASLGVEKVPPTKVFGHEPSPRAKPAANVETSGRTSTNGDDSTVERKQKSRAEPSEPFVEMKPKSVTESPKEPTPAFGTKPYSKTDTEPSAADEFTAEDKSKARAKFATEVKPTNEAKIDIENLSEKENISSAIETDLRPNTAATKAKAISEIELAQTGAALCEHDKRKEKIEPASELKPEPKVEEVSVSSQADAKVSDQYQTKEKYAYEKAEIIAKEEDAPPIKPRQKMGDASPSKLPKDEAIPNTKGTPSEEDVSKSKAGDIIDDSKVKTTDKDLDALTAESYPQQKAGGVSYAERKGETMSYLTSEGPGAEVMVGGLETPIRFGETRKVNVMVQDKNLSRALCTATMNTSNGTPINVPLEMKTECYDFQVTPEVPGQHMLRVEFAGVEVPGSPYAIDVGAIDISSVKVKGLETAIVLDETRPISIITSGVSTKVSCAVTAITPKGFFFDLPTFTTTEGHGTYFNPSEVGRHDITVYCAGQEAPGSPFTVMVEKKSVVVRGIESLLGMK